MTNAKQKKLAKYFNTMNKKELSEAIENKSFDLKIDSQYVTGVKSSEWCWIAVSKIAMEVLNG